MRLDDNDSLTKDIGKARISFDESSVCRVYELLSSWGNPFKESSSLVNIASGIEAHAQVEEDVLRAHDLGTEALRTFLMNKSRLAPLHSTRLLNVAI